MKRSIAALIAIAASLAACNAGSTATNTGNPGTDDPSLPDTIELIRSPLARDEAPDLQAAQLASFGDSSRDFALSLYAEVKAEEGNLFVSPYSISTALAMLYAGTLGETKSEMTSALHFDLPEPALHAAFNATDLALQMRKDEIAGDEPASGDGLQLSLANALFARAGQTFKEPYLDVLAEHYGTGVFATDFNASEVARKAINDWVLDKTEDRIDELLPMDSITPNVVFVLANAIYFKASWLEPFDPADTAKATFHADAGDVEVDMMHASQLLYYASGDGYQAVAIPYVSPSVRMLIVMPDEGRFEEIESNLDRASFDSIYNELREHDVQLQVPKFSYEAELELKPVLESLGMELAFVEDQADLSGITGQPGEVWVDEVYHKAFVALDEQGTEAAASTAVVAIGDAAHPPATFIADRPFLFMIYDDPTGQILFIGRLLNP